jgi:hypothetical protein
MSDSWSTPRTSQPRILVRPLHFDRQTSTDPSPLPPIEEGPLCSPSPLVRMSGDNSRDLKVGGGDTRETQTELRLQKLQDQVEVLTSE